MCQQGGENDHKDISVHTFGESAFFQGEFAFQLVLDLLSFVSGVEPVCLFLRASCVLLGRVEPFAHVFGDQVVAI